MSRVQEIEAASLEAAIEQAVRETGAARETLRFQMLREERGLLGASPKSVTIRVEIPDARPAPAREPAGSRRSRPPRRELPVASPPPKLLSASAPPPAEEGAAWEDEEEGREAAVSTGPDPTCPQVEEMVRELIRHLGLEVEVALSEEPDRIVVNLHGPDRELVLGERAETLDALQYLVGRMARKRFGTVKRVQVESDGFRSSREDELRAMAVEAAERARRCGEIVRLPALNPYERRIIHVSLSGMAGISTESDGDGFLKRVMVKPAGARRGGSGSGRRGGRPRGRGRD